MVKLTQSSRPFMRFENWRILGALKYLELEFKESFICDTSNINQILSKNLEIKMKPHQFEQLFLIFIDNAIKYDVKNKKIKVKTRLKNKQKIIEITDHGIGIPEEDQDFIFDRFYRVDKSRSRSQGGNGLGLSIAQKIIQLNGGSIKIKSEINKGTTFKIIF
ncbi:hypothetical protein B8A01_12745 [Staphylococcus aureus]|nr:hypothetical protein B8A01_12745 [Staphylococcus aureus]